MLLALMTILTGLALMSARFLGSRSQLRALPVRVCAAENIFSI